MRRSRDIVLIRMHEAFNTSGQVTSAAPEMSGRSNEAIFHDLVLRRPPPGTFNLVIYTDPLDSMLDSATLKSRYTQVVPITLVSLLLVKVWRQTLVAHWNQQPVFILNTFAHVLAYNVSAIVPLSLLQLYILDGAENILYGTHDPACRVGTSSCPLQNIVMEHQKIIDGAPCTLHPEQFSASATEFPTCAVNQPGSFLGFPWTECIHFLASRSLHQNKRLD